MTSQKLKRQRTEVEVMPHARSAGRQPMSQGELPAPMKHTSYFPLRTGQGELAANSKGIDKKTRRNSCIQSAFDTD